MGHEGGESAIEELFRTSSRPALAQLIRIFGDIDVAEDALQDAYVVALRDWSNAGVPAFPHAWVLRVARHRGIDRLRRESLGRALLADAIREQPEIQVHDADGAQPVGDDQLRLIFTCCHPALSAEGRVALSLRLLCGLQTHQIARAFLIEESTMAQRIVRAKRKIKDGPIPYRVPATTELPARLPAVLSVLYLVHNAGAYRPRVPGDLCTEAIRLTRELLALLPDEPEIAGLLSLLLLSQSRRDARMSPEGSLVRLTDQDRSLWDRALIEEGQELLRGCLRRDTPGPYQWQAAIQAVHADACTVEQTDWPQILSIYDQLFSATRSPVVALNRAIARAEVDGDEAALRDIDVLPLANYYLFHATRGELLQRLGRLPESTAAYRRAHALAPEGPERDYLNRRLTPSD
ncbi:MAG: DUF6596 domain-containing protein [Planctomycetota bacterium]